MAKIGGKYAFTKKKMVGVAPGHLQVFTSPEGGRRDFVTL